MPCGPNAAPEGLPVPLVADACGAPILRDHDRSAGSGTVRPIKAATTYMPCSSGHLHHLRSEADTQPTGLLVVTVTVRCVPLVPAAYGTRMARPARTTLRAPGGDGSQLARRVRPVPCDHHVVGKSSEVLAAQAQLSPAQRGATSSVECRVVIVR